MTDPARLEKLFLLAIAGGAVASLTWIALAALKTGSVDANGATLIGVVVGLLGATAKDIVSAIRGYSMSAQLGKVTDQLAASGPVTGSAAPDAMAAADEVADAAVGAADAIKGSRP